MKTYKVKNGAYQVVAYVFSGTNLSELKQKVASGISSVNSSVFFGDILFNFGNPKNRFTFENGDYLVEFDNNGSKSYLGNKKADFEVKYEEVIE